MYDHVRLWLELASRVRRSGPTCFAVNSLSLSSWVLGPELVPVRYRHIGGAINGKLLGFLLCESLLMELQLSRSGLLHLLPVLLTSACLSNIL